MQYPAVPKKDVSEQRFTQYLVVPKYMVPLAAFRLLHFSKHLPHGRTASYGTFPMHIIKHDNSIHFMGRKNVNPKEETAVGLRGDGRIG